MDFKQAFKIEFVGGKKLHNKLRICVNSQTPFMKFLLSDRELAEKYGQFSEFQFKLEDLQEGVDYQFTPGGVTAMILPLLKRMQAAGTLLDPIWVSLGGSNAPSAVVVDNLRLNHVNISPEDQLLYGAFKESIWNAIHGLGDFVFDQDQYEAYARYNWLSAEIMLKLVKDTDLFFIHDFQQLLTGNLVGPSAPKVLQWHIPLKLDSISAKLRNFILDSIMGFDSMIVSTRRELEGLIRAGFKGRTYQIYPYLDACLWTAPSPSEVELFKSKTKLNENDSLLLVVARMDPIKAQDIAIKAISQVSRTRNHIKLLFIGNGSFSSSPNGGLALPKSAQWKKRLQELTTKPGVQDKVIFAGYQPKDYVKAAYSLADVTIVPSKAEGFNLTTIESWMYKKPVIVSSGAGSSELVLDGVNGYTFTPGDDAVLAEKILQLLSNSETSSKMGECGFDTARICHVDRNINSLRNVSEETIANFK